MIVLRSLCGVVLALVLVGCESPAGAAEEAPTQVYRLSAGDPVPARVVSRREQLMSLKAQRDAALEAAALRFGEVVEEEGKVEYSN